MPRGKEWSENISLRDKLAFFRDTGEWPGNTNKETLTMFMKSNIEAELTDGKEYCAQRKTKAAKRVGLDID